MSRLPAFILTLTLLLSACGGDTAPTSTPPSATETPQPGAASEPATPYDGPALELTLGPVGNEMTFDQTSFTVKPGQTVHLVFRNTATIPAMQHNVVFVRSEADVQPVGMAAMEAADTEYVPASEAARILAHTPLAAPGQTVEVTFTAPTTPGAYPYICTFPGHFMMMKGTMQVQA